MAEASQLQLAARRENLRLLRELKKFLERARFPNLADRAKAEQLAGRIETHLTHLEILDSPSSPAVAALLGAVLEAGEVQAKLAEEDARAEGSR